MGFFSRLFRRHKDTEPVIKIDYYELAQQEIRGNRFYTNAPKHWVKINDGFLKLDDKLSVDFDGVNTEKVVNVRNAMVNSLALMDIINEYFSKLAKEKVHFDFTDSMLGSSERFATSCYVYKLFDKGVFIIDGVAIWNYEKYAIILLTSDTPISYINELKTYFVNDGYKDLIYYAKKDPHLVEGSKKLKFENFNDKCFRYDPANQGLEQRKHNEYALWWAGELEKDVKSSILLNDIGVYLDLLEFYNSYLLGFLSFAFGLNKEVVRTKMPDYEEVAITGPEGVEIIITLSEKKGIYFHFPKHPRYEKYRNAFIKVFVNFCYKIREQIIENDLPKDDFEHHTTLEWYTQLIEEAKEHNSEIAAIGLMRKKDSNFPDYSYYEN